MLLRIEPSKGVFRCYLLCITYLVLPSKTCEVGGEEIGCLMGFFPSWACSISPNSSWPIRVFLSSTLPLPATLYIYIYIITSPSQPRRLSATSFNWQRWVSWACCVWRPCLVLVLLFLWLLVVSCDEKNTATIWAIVRRDFQYLSLWCHSGFVGPVFYVWNLYCLMVIINYDGIWWWLYLVRVSEGTVTDHQLYQYLILFYHSLMVLCSLGFNFVRVGWIISCLDVARW